MKLTRVPYSRTTGTNAPTNGLSSPTNGLSRIACNGPTFQVVTHLTFFETFMKNTPNFILFKTYCYQRFFIRECSFGGEVSKVYLMRAKVPAPIRKEMPRHHRNFSRTKTRRGLSKMILDSTPMKISQRNTTEGDIDCMARPSKRD